MPTRMAGVRPGDVHYVEAHGPGTPVGDPIEAEALATVLACDRPDGRGAAHRVRQDEHRPPRGGVGHRGLIKAALVVKHRGTSRPACTSGTRIPRSRSTRYRLRVTAEAEAWPDGAPAFAGVNSFGFGGANAHVVLEGPAARARRGARRRRAPRAGARTLLVVSARSAESLRGLARAYRDLCRGQTPRRLPTSRRRRRPAQPPRAPARPSWARLSRRVADQPRRVPQRRDARGSS